MFNWTDLLIALGLVCVLEGGFYAAFPAKAQDMMRQAIDMPPERLRTLGLVAMIIGVAFIWFLKNY